MADEGLDPFRGRFIGRVIRPEEFLTTNAEEDIDIVLPDITQEYIRPFGPNDDNLEKRIEQIIQQKLSDLLLSHVCPICKKQLEE